MDQGKYTFSTFLQSQCSLQQGQLWNPPLHPRTQRSPAWPRGQQMATVNSTSLHPGETPFAAYSEHRAACCQGMRLVPPYMCFPSHPPPSPQGSRLRRAAGTLSHSLEVGILSETLPEGRGRPACPR
uniref:Uncharacterized protein n=1 Tax=Cairina moschata TaxID=8855 RepID=A0A8C3BM68_CAIMO